MQIDIKTKQRLYIMQGASGSGKSTRAIEIKNELANQGIVSTIHSTDDFFYVKDKNTGEMVYQWDGSKLSLFHAKNQECVRKSLTDGFSVIVDNTNIYACHVTPYVEMAISRGIPVVFVRCEGQFKNVHGVPDTQVEKMREKIEDLTVAKCLGILSSPYDSINNIPYLKIE